MEGDPANVEAFVHGDKEAIGEERARRLLALGVKLTWAPGRVREADVRALHEVGLGDAGIHDAVAVTAYFNFVNRIALGLGVELEPGDPA